MATCINIKGTYNCTCNTGWAGDGIDCTDVDECGDEIDECDSNANCSNTLGSYSCSCMDGFIGNGTTCEGWLNSILEFYVL